MTKDAYQEYLQSEHWQTMRARALERAGNRCQVCNSTNGLDVHHRTYERLGREQIEDLTVLCDGCHSLFHERQKKALRSTPLESALGELFEQLDERNQGDEPPSIPGLSTGLMELDEKLAGLANGEFIAVAGGPGVGKSAFLLNLVRHIVLECDHSALFVSLESNRVQIAEHLLAAQARVNGQKMRKGHLPPDDMQRLLAATQTFKSAKLDIDDSPRQNVMHIVASAHQLRQEKDLRVVFVDRLDLIEPDNPRDYRQEQIAVISRRFKNLAKELMIPVIASVGIGSVAEDRGDHRPQLSDLRQNSPVAQEADTVMLLHRTELYEPGQYEGAFEVLIAKQRNGPTGEVTLTFVKQFMRLDRFPLFAPSDS